MPNPASSLQDCWVIKRLLKICLSILIRKLVSPKPSVSILITKILKNKGRHQKYFCFLKDWSLTGFRRKGEETWDTAFKPKGVMLFEHPDTSPVAAAGWAALLQILGNICKLHTGTSSTLKKLKLN